MTKEKAVIFFLLLISALSFFAFGLFHLDKFETTDEHLWKYGRIKQYWQAVKNQDWEKTYINDKPGVTVALVSGVGLLSHPDPEQKQLLPVASGTFEKYDISETPKVNFAFRLPILIFATLSLRLFFWLAFSAFNSLWTALLATTLIAFNPILLGMSQIINPDSFFWIFGGLSAFSYLALLNTQKKKFVLICGVLTGFALLSKYTAFMLFLFHALAAFSKIIFQTSENSAKTNWKSLWQYARDLIVIFLISILVFSILLPAVFLKPEYLFKGISQFLNLKSIALLFVAASLTGLLAFFKRDFVGKFAATISSKRQFILAAVCASFLLLLTVSFANVWTGQKLAPVDALRDAAYTNEPKEYNFKPLIDKQTGIFQKSTQLFLMESYPFIFSLSPLLVLLIIFLSIKSFTKKISDESASVIFPIIAFSLLYFVSTMFAGIVTNVRYSILLYPFFALLAATAIVELGKHAAMAKKKFFLLFTLFIATAGILSFWFLKPFYFSYASPFLPQEFSIHDSWGHGSYEAAQHLNSLPNSENLVIWSNSDTVCRFFEGKCLRSRKIDLEIVTPDYFVVSKRGELKLSNRFVLVNNPSPEKDSDYYFEKLKSDAEWQLLIDNRPDNYVKIIKFEKNN